MRPPPHCSLLYVIQQNNFAPPSLSDNLYCWRPQVQYFLDPRLKLEKIKKMHLRLCQIWFIPTLNFTIETHFLKFFSISFVYKILNDI